jgi:hypothetical protein
MPAKNTAPKNATQSKPNILVIWGDDIGISNLSCYSHGLMGYQTPNIDRLAKEGWCSPIPTANRAAPPGVRPSSPGRASIALAFR